MYTLQLIHSIHGLLSGCTCWESHSDPCLQITHPITVPQSPASTHVRSASSCQHLLVWLDVEPAGYPVYTIPLFSPCVFTLAPVPDLDMASVGMVEWLKATIHCPGLTFVTAHTWSLLPMCDLLCIRTLLLSLSYPATKICMSCP